MARGRRRSRSNRLLGLLISGILIGIGLGGLRVIDCLHLAGEIEILDGLAPHVGICLGVGLHDLDLVEHRFQGVAHSVVRYLAVAAREQRVPVSDCLVQVRLDRPGLVVGSLLHGGHDLGVGHVVLGYGPGSPLRRSPIRFVGLHAPSRGSRLRPAAGQGLRFDVRRPSPHPQR